jgi:hypothetical protein
MRAGLCIPWVVNVFMKGTVKAGAHSQSLDRDGSGVQFVSVAKMDERMCNWIVLAMLKL